MDAEKRAVLALVAGVVLYQLLGTYAERLHGFVDSLVLADLAVRTILSHKPD